MNFPLDLRFVFVLRCLYRQGEKVSKPRKTAKKPEFWQKIKTNINLIDKNVNTYVNTSNRLNFYKPK